MRESLRDRRYERRAEVLWPLSSLERVRKCGRVPNGNAGAGLVGLRYANGVAGFSGLCTCGSVWACSVCNAKVMAKRALEIGAAVAVWQARGGSVVFSTLTMRHRKGQGLGDLWNGIQAGWTRVTGGKGWLTDKGRHGIVGWVKVVEVTLGRHGWHVHVHALLMMAGTVTDSQVQMLHGSMFARWSAGITAKGFGKPLADGQKARLITGPADTDLARYFSKATDAGLAGGLGGSPDGRVRPTDGSPARRDTGTAVGLEFTQTQGKQARTTHGTSTPWSLLDRIQLEGDADALDLWHEWEKGSKGRRQISWAVGLRADLGLAREKTDDEIASEVIGDADLLLITSAGWAVLLQRHRLIPQLLTATERGGFTAAREFLDGHEIEYRLMGEER